MGRQHTEALFENHDAEPVAVADIRAQVAEDVGAQFGAKPYSDYNEMLKNEELDLVTVATPDPLHREPVVAAIEAGVPNIIQEKPFTTTVADAEAICEAVEKRGTRVFMNFSNRARPMDVASRYVIQAGLLGRVVYGEYRLDDNITVPLQMWGNRSRDWAGGSSTAHFLLSHVVDLLRWYFAPAEVTQVYAINQQEVLKYTPDVYDAFLTFDTGLKVRIKAEWIRRIDTLVESYTSFSGSEGTLVYNKLSGFNMQDGWRANVSSKVDAASLEKHRSTLRDRGVNVAALIHQPTPTRGRLAAGGGEEKYALEARSLPPLEGMPLVPHCVNAIVESTPEPSSWRGNGPLPNHVDGLRQTQVVAAIVESSNTGKVIDLV